MKSIYLNDGTNVLIFNTEDVINTIKYNLSDELAQWILDAMEDMKSEMKSAIFDFDDLKSDFDDLDEENSRLIRENHKLKEEIEKLKDELEIRDTSDEEDVLPFW